MLGSSASARLLCGAGKGLAREAGAVHDGAGIDAVVRITAAPRGAGTQRGRFPVTGLPVGGRDWSGSLDVSERSCRGQQTIGGDVSNESE
jgi:hypothetical protein